jgi:hypothetical protein
MKLNYRVRLTFQLTFPRFSSTINHRSNYYLSKRRQEAAMRLNLEIIGADGAVKARVSDEKSVTLVYSAAYEQGDRICLQSDKPDKGGFITAQLEDSIIPVFGFLKGAYQLLIPFGEKRVSYSAKSFTGENHLLWAREAEPLEIQAYRNLALNPLDSHNNSGFFPHAEANVETRGEAVFAARNAVNGNITSGGHGRWPYESWGINRQADARIKIDFGRTVRIDKLTVTLRADFPHDNWWKQATVTFSDGSAVTPLFIKSGLSQSFAVSPRAVEWLTMGELIKDESDPSPFPALVQLECWGRN